MDRKLLYEGLISTKGNAYKINGNVAECLLPDGSITLVSIESIPLLQTCTWCKGGNGYVMTHSTETAISMQRFLTKAKPGEIVDHIDRNPLNNTLENLRICTKQTNAVNTPVRSDNSTGYKGVSYHKKAGKFRAYIVVNGKQIHLGLFDTAEQAAQKYAEAAQLFYGAFSSVTKN